MLWLELMIICEQGFSFATMESEENLGHEGQQHKTKWKRQRIALCLCAHYKGLHVHNESIIYNHMIKWGPSIVVDDLSFINVCFKWNIEMKLCARVRNGNVLNLDKFTMHDFL
jgi:hypothetical protein